MKRLLLTSLLSAGLVAAATAAPITLTGSYVQVGVSDYGTLGSNSSNVGTSVLICARKIKPSACWV